MLDIIIPCWNNMEYTKRCIHSVCAFTYRPFRLIIVDDGSTDGTADLVKSIRRRFQPSLVHLSHPVNLGFSYAVNTGVGAADGEYICIMNNDVEVLPNDWAGKMIGVLEKDPSVGMVVPVQSFPVGRACVMCNDGGTVLEETKYATMAMSVHPAKVWEKVGLLDASIDANGSTDFDWNLRLRRAGYRILIHRQVPIVHAKSASVRNLPSYKTGEFQRENYREFTALRRKWGDAVVERVIHSMWVKSGGGES